MKVNGGQGWAPTSLDIKVRNRFKYRHNAQFTDIISSFFSAVPNRFKYRNNAQFTILVFIIFCCSKSFQIPSQCMLKLHCFHLFLCSSKSFNIPSECFRYIVLNSFLQFQSVSTTVWRQNACFRDIIFQKNQHFPIFSNTVRMHIWETLFSKSFLQF